MEVLFVNTPQQAKEQENISPLDAPSAHPLDVLLRELKWGRKAAQQHLIDKWIAELTVED